MDVDQHVDRYIVVRLLGQGGMGTVYAARDPELDRMVALKVLRADAAGKATQHERLRREAQAMAQLSHPNVVAIHDVGTAGNGQIFIAMEYVEGLTLATWLAVEERTPADIITHFVEAARGLSAAHRAGLVHRDFKPENVLVGTDGRVRVTDFGLARSVDHAPPAAERVTRDLTIPSAPDETPANLTATGTVVGTPLYMAPEQYRGELADARTDQFAFCVALHAALYRVRPFEGDTFEQLSQAVLSGRRTPAPEIPGVSVTQRMAIVRGMSLAPGERFPSIDTLIDALVPPPEPAPTPRARRRVLVRAVIVGIAIGAAATTVILVGKLRGGGSGEEPGFCDRDLAGVWDGERRATIARAIGDTKVAYAASTSQRVLAAGDRFAEAWLGRRDRTCHAFADKSLAQDAFALAQMCLTLRRSDAKAVLDRLATTPTASEAAHAIDAVDIGGGPPLAACDDREYLRVLVGPPDAKSRSAINAILRPLHDLRAQLALGDIAAGRAAATAQLPAVRGFELPAVRAELLVVAAELAFADDDVKAATALVAEAVSDAALGRHDLIEARARVDQLAIAIAGDAEVTDAAVEAARSAVAHVKQRRALDVALASAEGALAAKRGDFAKAHDRDSDAVHAADASGGPADAIGAAPRLQLATTLVAAHAPEALAAAQDALAYHARVYGDDHPLVARALLVVGDAQRDAHDLSAAYATYKRAEALATDDTAARADAYAHEATIAGTGEALKLVDRALALDGTALRADHPQAVRHRAMRAALLRRHEEAMGDSAGSGSAAAGSGSGSAAP